VTDQSEQTFESQLRRAMKAKRWGMPSEQAHLCLMVTLTFTTGINDAVGYLGLDRVFTGNMTGNVVILGMALTGTTPLPVLGPALALVGFLVGAAVAGRVLRHETMPWGPLHSWLLVGVAGVMLALGSALLAAGPLPSHRIMVTATTLAALALGAQAATARAIAVKDVTTVVVTSTLTGLAADSFFGNGRGGGTTRRVVTVVALLLGAVVGALLLLVSLSAGFFVAGALIGASAVVGELHRRAQNAASEAS